MPSQNIFGFLARWECLNIVSAVWFHFVSKSKEWQRPTGKRDSVNQSAGEISKSKFMLQINSWRRTEVVLIFHLAMGSKAILSPELDDEENKWKVKIDSSSKVS